MHMIGHHAVGVDRAPVFGTKHVDNVLHQLSNNVIGKIVVVAVVAQVKNNMRNVINCPLVGLAGH